MDAPLSGTEAAILGPLTRAEADAWLAHALEQAGAGGLAEVLFRAGRIDAVYGVRATDGRRLVVKAHRPPAEPGARRAVVRAQTALAEAGFPCPTPVAGPLAVEGRTVTVETLLEAGAPADPRDPAIRRAMAAGLVDHVGLLSTVPGLAPFAVPPAWCRYRDGPWPVPHDTIFDFSVTPDGYEWLDDLARRATAVLADDRGEGPVVVGHADWYPGNLRFAGDRLVAAFDWDLVADTAPVVAGITAAACVADAPSGPQAPAPDAIAAFLADVEDAAGRRFDAAQQRVAAGAATWVLAYNARCDLALQDPSDAPRAGSPLDVAARAGADVLALRW
jgi:Phosphotransferase enzyme family